ncbi:MAG TPA: glycosyltransferase [Patescibacteria group bacterium]|nr:glycosyltransferase [Patescibacteria group bacterium]
MKLFLIKIGKAFHTLKREGVVRGGRRILAAFFALFRRVGSGDILFVTGGVGDSALYRCHHVAEELERHGFHCGITVQDNPFLPRYAEKFSVFIFHRVLFTPSVAKLIERIKERNKTIIFETDDLVYDPRYLAYMDYYTVMNPLERKLYEHGVGGEILDDPYVKTCTTTTFFLAHKLREKEKNVFIVPNRLAKKDVSIAQSVLRERRSDAARVTLAYFSGTASHNKDFATIVEPLARILAKYPQARVAIHGPLDLPDDLKKFGDRIVQTPYVAREKHFHNIARSDVNLAPLEIGNPFCEAKSELKFFEAGIVGVPTVASATRTFREAIADGIDGFVASTADEWVAKLSQLIESADRRNRMGELAMKKASQFYTTQNAENEGYYAFLRNAVHHQ